MGTQTLNYEPAYDHHEDDQFNDEMYEHHGYLDDFQNYHDHHIDYNDHHDYSTDDWITELQLLKVLPPVLQICPYRSVATQPEALCSVN